MATIIAATDFSEVATNALYYACDMARAYGTGVTVFHSYIIPVNFADTAMPVVTVEEAKNIADEQMQNLASKLQLRYPGLLINQQVSYGEITDSLNDYTEQNRPLMIVVGNSNEDGGGILFGGSLLSELRNLPWPVMAVPGSLQFRQPKKLCLACDFKNIENHLPVEDIIRFSTQFRAELHVLNIDFDNKSFGVNTPIESTALHNMLKPLAPQYHYMENKDVESGINTFIQENEIDWLLVIPHKYNFFERLFHKSHTKQLVEKVHIPIIALHEK